MAATDDKQLTTTMAPDALNQPASDNTLSKTSWSPNLSLQHPPVLNQRGAQQQESAAAYCSMTKTNTGGEPWWQGGCGGDDEREY